MSRLQARLWVRNQIKEGDDTTREEELTAADARAIGNLARELKSHACAWGQRRAMVLGGDAAWTLSTAASALAALPGSEPLWLSDRPTADRRFPLSHGDRLLGREIEVLVYDAHSGFDPDSFGAALGALRGGGLLLLLTPPLEHWPDTPDPQAARVAVYPYRTEQVSGRFIRRCARVLTESPGVKVLSQGEAVPTTTPGALAPTHPPSDPESVCRTPDQARAVEEILKTARGRARRPLVLTSDRGRGKSSALGIATARLLAEGRCILVTAPRRSAVEPLFRHATGLLWEVDVHSNRISYRGAKLEFLPPDELARSPRRADLVLVDEAAGIPAPLLERLLRANPRVAFATTVHGYEGTGRGFEVRFRRTLDRLTPQWREFTLRIPIRWSPDDPLEGLASRALLLDATPAAEAAVADAKPANCRFERLERDSIADSEPTLSQLFGLLVLAHYQTRPMDLRHLLDGPNIRVYALRYKGQVGATALVALEGGLNQDLAGAVFEGRRRPRGHLLPQTLSAHAGIEEAPLLRFARVVRIAVHPTAQGRGLGRRLLEGIIADARMQGLDLVGASFGATAELLAFWKCCGFPPVHLGTSRNAASGEHAAVVLQALTPEGEGLRSLALQRLGEHLSAQLAGPLRDLAPRIAASLLANTPSRGAALQPRERRELDSFAFAHRTYEAALPALVRLLSACLAQGLRRKQLTAQEGDLLIAQVLQHRGFAGSAKLLGLSGRAEVIALLRKAAGKLLDQFGPR